MKEGEGWGAAVPFLDRKPRDDSSLHTRLLVLWVPGGFLKPVFLVSFALSHICLAELIYSGSRMYICETR